MQYNLKQQEISYQTNQLRDITYLIDQIKLSNNKDKLVLIESLENGISVSIIRKNSDLQKDELRINSVSVKTFDIGEILAASKSFRKIAKKLQESKYKNIKIFGSHITTAIDPKIDSDLDNFAELTIFFSENKTFKTGTGQDGSLNCVKIDIVSGLTSSGISIDSSQKRQLIIKKINNLVGEIGAKTGITHATIAFNEDDDMIDAVIYSTENARYKPSTNIIKFTIKNQKENLVSGFNQIAAWLKAHSSEYRFVEAVFMKEVNDFVIVSLYLIQ